MSTSLLSQPFDFLRVLEKNNDREWFKSNKSTYLAAHAEVIEWADQLLKLVNQTDVIETSTGKKSLYRIYRDVRFSKDKTPYSTYFGGGFRRASAMRRGGYYFHLSPKESYVCGGFWGPNAADLLHLRKQIQQDPDALRTILVSKNFKSNFGSLLGNQLKRAPKGFDVEDPAIDLLRYKQYYVQHDFTLEEVMRPDFIEKVAAQFAYMRPFFDLMTDLLTTDLNGESTL